MVSRVIGSFDMGANIRGADESRDTSLLGVSAVRRIPFRGSPHNNLLIVGTALSRCVHIGDVEHVVQCEDTRFPSIIANAQCNGAAAL